MIGDAFYESRKISRAFAAAFFLLLDFIRLSSFHGRMLEVPSLLSS
jgi:hypothetical protein